MDEAEVEDVAEVVFGDGGEGLAGEEGLDDLADAGLAEALGEAVEVGVLAADQLLLGGVDDGRGDRLGGIGDELLDRLLGERVDQPGLALGEVKGACAGLGGEDLAGVLGVLGVELGDLLGGEVAEGEGADLDVEGAGGAEATGAVGVAAGWRGLVVADVAEADERERTGEVGGAAGVAVAELAEDGDQDGPGEGVDLVEEEDEGARAGARPGLEGGADPGAGGRLGPGGRLELGGEAPAGGAAPGVEDRDPRRRRCRRGSRR